MQPGSELGNGASARQQMLKLLQDPEVGLRFVAARKVCTADEEGKESIAFDQLVWRLL